MLFSFPLLVYSTSFIAVTSAVGSLWTPGTHIPCFFLTPSCLFVHGIRSWLFSLPASLTGPSSPHVLQRLAQELGINSWQMNIFLMNEWIQRHMFNTLVAKWMNGFENPYLLLLHWSNCAWMGIPQWKTSSTIPENLSYYSIFSWSCFVFGNSMIKFQIKINLSPCTYIIGLTFT